MHDQVCMKADSKMLCASSMSMCHVLVTYANKQKKIG